MIQYKKTSERASEFACHLIAEFRRGRSVDDAERLIWRELLKAGTSVGANTSESECLFWLRLLRHARPDRGGPVNALQRECDAIVSILVVSLRTAKRKKNGERAKRERPKSEDRTNTAARQ